MCMSDAQAGFRKDRSTVQQILMLRLIAEKAKTKTQACIQLFCGFPEGIRLH